MRGLGRILSVTGLGLLAGGMLLFPIMTFLLFTRLPFAVAGPFVSGCFPVYYGFMLTLSALACLGFGLRAEFKTTFLLGCISLTTLWAWFWLIPHLTLDRLAGNMSAFNRGHTISVWLDGLQFILVLVLLMREGVRRT